MPDKNYKSLKDNINGLQIKTSIENQDWSSFFNHLQSIEKYLSPDTKVLIVKLFMQLGTALPHHKNRLLNYENKNSISVNIQPKVKNYIEFKSIESAEKYIKEEISIDELCIYLEVENGRIKLDRFKDPYVKTIYSILKSIQDAFIQKYDIRILPLGDAIDSINFEELIRDKKQYKISRTENKNVVNNMYNTFIRKISDDIREINSSYSQTTYHSKSIKIIIYDLHQFPLSKDELTLEYDILWNK